MNIRRTPENLQEASPAFHLTLPSPKAPPKLPSPAAQSPPSNWLLDFQALSSGATPLKAVQHTHDCIAHLRQRKLLPDTNAGAAIEGDVVPGLVLPSLPAVRIEVQGVKRRVGRFGI